MAIPFKCAGCGKQYSVAESLAGKKAQCKKCGQVMMIPTLAPSGEPDLRLEGDPAPATGAETVAGSLVQHSMGTVAGRGASQAGQSAAGRSTSGRSLAGQNARNDSVAGRSAAGRPAYTPPPEPLAPPEPAYDDAPSELAALNHVAQSDHDVFDINGPTDQPLRDGRGPARSNNAGPEAVSLLLVAGLVAVLGYASFAKMQAATAGVPADVIAETGKPLVPVLVQSVVVLALTAAVAAPLVLVGWLGACKILNFRTPDGLFVRSLGLASLPVAAFVLAYTLGMADVAVLAAVATAAVGYVVLQFVHAQRPVLAGVAAALGTVGGAVGVAVAVMAADAASAGLTKTYRDKVQIAAAKVQDRRTLAIAKAPTAVGPVGPLAHSAEADAAAKEVRGQIEALRATLTDKRQARETVEATAAAVAASLSHAKAAFPDRPEWDAMAGDLQSTQSAIAALPTAKVPADLNEAPPAGPEWGVKPGRREASAFAYNLTPPPDALLDLDSAGGERGPMTWSLPQSQAKMKVEVLHGTSAQQQRPWVAPAFVIAAAKDAPVSVAADGTPTVEYGAVNGLPAARIVAPAGESGLTNTVYTVHHGDNWLRATIGPAGPGDPAIAAGEAAVRSLRVRSPGEPAADPLPAVDLVARFTGDPSSSDRVSTLLRGKPGAEDAVLKAIGFAPDDATLKKFGPLLAAAATGEKGTHFLWKLADANDEAGKSARDALRRVSPKTADDVAFALLDLKSQQSARVGEGLNALGTAEVDKARQPAVSKALAASFDDLAGGGQPQLFEGVLQKWLDDDLGRRVQAVLNDPNSGQSQRRLAMRVLASTGKQKYVASICNWLVADSSAAVDTLIQMGPMVEGDVINTLVDRKNTNPKLRLAAFGVLSEIGTTRSITTLQKLTGTIDPEVNEAAKSTILKLKEKAKTSPAAQPK